MTSRCVALVHLLNSIPKYILLLKKKKNDLDIKKRKMYKKIFGLISKTDMNQNHFIKLHGK